MNLQVIESSHKLRGYVIDKDGFVFTDSQLGETFDAESLYDLADQGVFIGSKALVLLAFLFGRGVTKITLNPESLRVEVESGFFAAIREADFALGVMQVINKLYIEELGDDQLDGVEILK